MIPYHHHHHHHHHAYSGVYHHQHHGHHLAAARAAAAAAAAAAASASAAGGHDPNHVASRMFFKIPRVSHNQRQRFDEEDVFKKNSREQEVRYTLYRDRPIQERQAKFQQGCREGHVELSHSSTGLVLILTWNPMACYASAANSSVADGCDFNREPGRVHISSPLIVNGVCVRWRGWVDLDRLDGLGRIDFDEEAALAEDAVLRQQVQIYRDIEDAGGLRHLKEAAAATY